MESLTLSLPYISAGNMRGGGGGGGGGGIQLF